jgi:hypothetical protein
MNFKHNNKVITKKIEGKEDWAPSLQVQVSRAEPTKPKSKKYNIKIVHPNSKKVIYNEVHKADSFQDALELGKKIKAKQFDKVEIYYEEVLHIPRPRRGKMQLHLEEDHKTEENKEND